MKLPLKRLRENKKMTQMELSKKLNIAPSTVGMWEQGYRNPNYEDLKRISKLFGVTTDYLLDNENATAQTFSEDETDLVYGYRRLNPERQRLIRGMIYQLNEPSPPVQNTFTNSGTFTNNGNFANGTFNGSNVNQSAQ